MMSQGSQEDEAAVLLGASSWKMFWRVTLPNIRWALLYGVVLTNARAIGNLVPSLLSRGYSWRNLFTAFTGRTFAPRLQHCGGFYGSSITCHDGNYYING